MKKLVIEFSNERLITPSGLSLVGQLLGKSNFIKKCNRFYMPRPYVRVWMT